METNKAASKKSKIILGAIIIFGVISIIINILYWPGNKKVTAIESNHNKIVIPTKEELKKESNFVAPMSHMLQLKDRINKEFASSSMQKPLHGCIRFSKSQAKCTISFLGESGTAYIGGGIVAGLYINAKPKYQKIILADLARPLLIAFMPNSSYQLIKDKESEIINGFNYRGKSIYLYPYYGSMEYKVYPDKIRIVINGSPMKEYRFDK